MLTSISMISNDGHSVVCGEDESCILVPVEFREECLGLLDDGVHHLDVCHVFLARAFNSTLQNKAVRDTLECGLYE